MKRNLNRRGSMLLLVAVLIVVCALLGAAVAVRVQADGNLSQLRRRDDQLRALAWSGIRIVMQSAHSQRSEILSGVSLNLPESAVAFQDDQRGEQGVVHFEAVPDATSSTPSTTGEERRAVGQASLVDLNLADAAMLERMGFDAAAAAGIISRRPSGGFALPDDAQIEPPATQSQTAGPPVQPGVPLGDLATTTPSPALGAAIFTTTSWDSQEPGAVHSATGTSSLPQRRLLLGSGLTDEDRRDLDGIVGAAAKAQLEPMLNDAAWKGKKLSDVVLALAAAGVQPRQIGAVLDLVTAESSAFPRGRLDLLRATPEAMLTRAGIDRPLAERLVGTRASLDQASRSDLAWPLTQGVLTTEQFAAIADTIANRSLQWRVRVRAVIEKLGSPSSSSVADSTQTPAPTVELTMDVIVDCSGPAVRVVTMYDSTWQPTADAVLAARKRRPPPEEPPPSAQPDPVAAAQGQGTTEDRPPEPRDNAEGVMIPRSESGTTSENQTQPSPQGSAGGGRSGRWRPRQGGV